MEVYTLTNLGRRLAHSTHNPLTVEWAVVHFLNRHGSATREQILEYVPGASVTTLAKLRVHRVISQGVEASL